VWTNEIRGRYERSGLRYPSDLTNEEWAWSSSLRRLSIGVEKGPPPIGVRPWGWTDWAVGIDPPAGLPEDGSHDEAPITQRRVQAAGR